MFGHCGKKLLFMGQDFGQDSEWSEARELEWNLMEDDLHSGMAAYVGELLKLYNKYPCLYEMDYDTKGFRWINADDTYKSIYSFARYSVSGKNNMLFVLNFTPIARDDYRVGVPENKKYRLILNSDEKRFGGSGREQEEYYVADELEWDGQDFSIAYPLPAYGAAIFLF